MDAAKVITGFGGFANKDPKNIDSGKMLKLGKHVAALIVQHRLFNTPQNVNPRRIVASIQNRRRQPPSVANCHCVVYKSIRLNEYDPMKNNPGVLQRFTTKMAELESHVSYNKEFTDLTPALHPPIHENEVDSVSLACTHLNHVFRLIDAEMVSPITNIKFEVGADEELKKMIKDGHRSWVLDENLTPEDVASISEWRNVDQNANMTKRLVEIISHCQVVCLKSCSLASKVAVMCHVCCFFLSFGTVLPNSLPKGGWGDL